MWAEAKTAFEAEEPWWFNEDMERQQFKNNAPWQQSNEVVANKVYKLTERSLGSEPRAIDWSSRRSFENMVAQGLRAAMPRGWSHTILHPATAATADPDEDWYSVQLTEGYEYTVEFWTSTAHPERHQATQLKVLRSSVVYPSPEP